MSKEVETKTCDYCESVYKLVYVLDDTSGHPKFCPFCGEDAYNKEDEADDFIVDSDE